MNILSVNYPKVFIYILLTIFAVMINSGPTVAGDDSMQTNLNEIADQMDRWSKQCSTTKMTPEAQQKLSELLAQASQLLKEMAAKSGAEMHGEHREKIMMMEKSWDPFDTSDRM